MLAELFSNPAVSRALVIGVFGGVALVLTVLYSRRGPLIYPVYAALLAAIALLLARYPAVPYPGRFGAALAAFLMASAPLYVAAGVLAGRERRRLRAEGRLPPAPRGIPVVGHLWRAGLLLAVGVVVSAGVAFVAA